MSAGTDARRAGGAPGLGVVATGNVHYHDARAAPASGRAGRDQEPHDAGRQPSLRRENSEYYLKPPDRDGGGVRRIPGGGREHASHRRALPVRPDARPRLPASPDYPCRRRDGRSRTCATLCRQEAARRYARFTPQVEERLEQELRLVEKHGLSGFFLIYREILQLAEKVADEVHGPRHATARPGAGAARLSARSSAT